MKHTSKNRGTTSRSMGSSMARNSLNPATLDMLPIGVLLLDRELRIVSVNAEAARLLGHSTDFCSLMRLQDVWLQEPGASGHSIVTRIHESLHDRRPIQATRTTLSGPGHESYLV